MLTNWRNRGADAESTCSLTTYKKSEKTAESSKTITEYQQSVSVNTTNAVHGIFSYIEAQISYYA
jgi:hypothetical protein